MMASRDMAKLRAGADRHSLDRRWARPDDSSGKVLDSAGGSTSYARCMIAVWLVCAGCPGPAATRPPPSDPADAPHSTLADDDFDGPSWGSTALQGALSAGRRIGASLERRVAELEAREP